MTNINEPTAPRTDQTGSGQNVFPSLNVYIIIGVSFDNLSIFLTKEISCNILVIKIQTM